MGSEQDKDIVNGECPLLVRDRRVTVRVTLCTVEITQSHRLAEGKHKVHKQRGVQRKGESHLAEGKYKEKSLRIPTACEPVLYTPLTAARAINRWRGGDGIVMAKQAWKQHTGLHKRRCTEVEGTP
jgi:hypothetical protein